MSEVTGTGIAFPLRVDAHGSLALSRDERDVEEAIAVVIGTARGERPMRPEFGCGIHNYVFASADATTAGLLSVEVKRSLTRWEPRIDINDVAVSVDQVDRNALYITISYTIKGSNDARTRTG